MGRDILVDGYNVIKRAPSFQAVRAQGLATARAQLLVLLRNRYRHTPHQVIVVFDGNEVHEQTSHEQRIRIIYSRHGESADSVIARLAANARVQGREIEIYSDDLEVQRSVTSQGGSMQSTAQLEREMYAAPHDVERRSRHRMAMRRKYGLDTNTFQKDSADDDAFPRPPGKKKKRRR
ncbi:MAG TPA: NYN domain-containing protein [Ktedonobacteraceae bacterium]